MFVRENKEKIDYTAWRITNEKATKKWVNDCWVGGIWDGRFKMNKMLHVVMKVRCRVKRW